MINYRSLYLLPLIFLMSFACFEIKTFYSNKDNAIVIVGNKNNALFNELNDPELLFDPNILKVDYIEEVKKIILKHVILRELVDEKAEFSVHLYFNPENLHVEEVYFLYRNITPEKVFTSDQMKAIEQDLKYKIVGTKNINWINIREIDRQLKGAKFVNHSLGFKVNQLFSFKKGDLSEDKIWIL
ncbi:hypothetical protein [Sphingobacterium faecium]|uniref:hypothetical protein n=1 Tax=Sphingobacterium faecium TaxID=34087 RepID=UPI003207A9E2